MNKKDVISRAVKTFIEAALGYALVNLGSLSDSISLDAADPDLLPHTVTCVLISAVAAGVSAVWNGVIEPLFEKGK